MAEHIIQISVSCDDETIVKLAEESAAKQLVKEIFDEESGSWHASGRSEAIRKIKDDATRQLIDIVIEEHLDTIAKLVAERLSRSKAFREKTAELIVEKEV